MKIIVSPTKKMRVDTDSLECRGLPVFLKDTEGLLEWLRTRNYDELKQLWKCNDQIAKRNLERIQEMKLCEAQTPAILSYEGIAFQYMAPSVFEDSHLEYVQQHLRILSAFYGVLKPFDAVTPYRLEMQAEAAISSHRNLYDFWGRKLYDEISDQDGVIINLASKEYSKCIEAFLKPEDSFITCYFGEIENGTFKQKGTYAKMARGDMVRFLAHSNATSTEDIKAYNGLQYTYASGLSTDRDFYFIRKTK